LTKLQIYGIIKVSRERKEVRGPELDRSETRVQLPGGSDTPTSRTRRSI